MTFRGSVKTLCWWKGNRLEVPTWNPFANINIYENSSSTYGISSWTYFTNNTTVAVRYHSKQWWTWTYFDDMGYYSCSKKAQIRRQWPIIYGPYASQCCDSEMNLHLMCYCRKQFLYKLESIRGVKYPLIHANESQITLMCG